MDERIAIIGVIVEDLDSSQAVNQVLHSYSQYIKGRMGLPQVSEKASVIALVVKAPQDKISAMAGKLGMIKNISVSTLYSKCHG